VKPCRDFLLDEFRLPGIAIIRQLQIDGSARFEILDGRRFFLSLMIWVLLVTWTVGRLYRHRVTLQDDLVGQAHSLCLNRLCYLCLSAFHP
jgi:hypothetical protein